MKILLVTEFFPKDNLLKFTGGVEVRTYYLHKELIKRHQITVLSRPPQKVSFSFISLVDRFIFILKAIATGLQSNAELVEGSNFVTYIPAFVVGSIKHIPTVAWYPDVFIGSWVEKFGLVGLVGELIERAVLKLPWSHIIALSKQTREKLIKAGVSSSKITVVYAGVDQTEFKIHRKKSRLPTICCISRDVPYKRLNDLKTAFEIVKQTMPYVKLVIISGQLSRADLVKKLKTSHVFCLPSVVEGFGLVTLEALAADIPYVNADISINREITHNGLGGLLFEPKSPQALAAKILQLLTNHQLYLSKLREGKQLLQHYSWSKSAQETELVYQSLIQEHKKIA